MKANISRHLRTRRQADRVAPDARCRLCGYADPTALMRDEGGITCYECANAARGRRTTEENHPILRVNGQETVTTPGNVHRSLSHRQQDWPEPLVSGHGGDPLLIIAAVLRAVGDFAGWTAQYAERFSDWLVALWCALVERYGERWWESLGLPPLWGTP